MGCRAGVPLLHVVSRPLTFPALVHCPYRAFRYPDSRCLVTRVFYIRRGPESLNTIQGLEDCLQVWTGAQLS